MIARCSSRSPSGSERLPPDPCQKTGHEPAAFLDRPGLAPRPGGRHRRLRALAAARRPDRVVRLAGHRGHAARPGDRAGGRAASGADRNRADRRWPGRPRHALRDASRRHPVARHPDLHLACGQQRHAALRRGPAGGGARRARAPAARRREHAGAGSDLRAARCAAQHPAQALQPVHEPGLARARLPRRLPSPQPAHAQQVVHGRQPGGDRRRPQHRRRVLRGGRGAGLRRHRRPRRRRRRACDLDRVRPLLEQRLGVPGAAHHRSRAGHQPGRVRGAGAGHQREPVARAPMSKPCTARPRPRPCSPVS